MFEESRTKNCNVKFAADSIWFRSPGRGRGRGQGNEGRGAVILRVLRGRVIQGQEQNLGRFVRDEAVANALSIPGLLSFQPAIRETRAGSELVIVSTWTGFETIAAAGRDLDSPLSMPNSSNMLSDSHAEHYELVIGESRAMPLRKA